LYFPLSRKDFTTYGTCDLQSNEENKICLYDRMNATVIFFIYAMKRGSSSGCGRGRENPRQATSQPANSLLLRWAAVWMESIRAL
jgi:hypothetical protein